MSEIRSKSKNIQRWLERPDRPAIAPVELAGQWVAWDWKQTKILAHADTMEEADALGRASGEKYVLQKVSRPNVIFIGAA